LAGTILAPNAEALTPTPSLRTGGENMAHAVVADLVRVQR
jgi:hypothetical protein